MLKNELSELFMEISITSKSWLLLGREAESTATSFKGRREFGPRDSQVRTRTDAAAGEGAVTLRYLTPLLLKKLPVRPARSMSGHCKTTSKKEFISFRLFHNMLNVMKDKNPKKE